MRMHGILVRIIRITVDVRTLTEKIIREWGSGTWKVPSQNENAPHEAGYLKLDSAKSMARLGWKPAYAIDEAIRKTIGWYRNYYAGNTGYVRIFPTAG